MTLMKCKECGTQVSDTAKACPGCGAKIKQKTSKLTWAVIGTAFIVYAAFQIRNETNGVPVVAQQTHPSSNRCVATYSKEGWLVDHDRRGEVALRQEAGAPSASNPIVSTVTWPEVVRGKPMITTVRGECAVNGILYYLVAFDENRNGWVDVDYLHWKRPAL
ncbi:MAG: zinc-ribbon domain-containing protein [Polaromonas sp.]